MSKSYKEMKADYKLAKHDPELETRPHPKARKEKKFELVITMQFPWGDNVISYGKYATKKDVEKAYNDAIKKGFSWYKHVEIKEL